MTDKRIIEIFDTTLRDGAQGEGISYSVRDKLYIMRALDEFGVDYIEAGNPGSNPKDAEFFKSAAKTPLRCAKLCAFGATRRKKLKANEDSGLESLIAAEAPSIAIFGKAHLLRFAAGQDGATITSFSGLEPRYHRRNGFTHP